MQCMVMSGSLIIVSLQITSLHGGDSQLIMWNIDTGEAIGSFCLPLSYSLLSDPKGTLATGSDVTAVIAKMEDTEVTYSGAVM